MAFQPNIEGIRIKGTLSGITYIETTTISASTYLGISTTDTYVTGGTYSSGTLTLDRNDGDTVTVTGFTTGGGDNFYVTGFTYNDTNTLTISRNGGLSDLSATINTLTGLTINGVFSASTYTGITLTSLDDVTSNIPSTPDNTYQGRLLYFDAPSNQWLTGEEYVSAGNVTIWGKKGSVGTIDKGCPVYITGFDNDVHEVELANASTGSTMPVIGFTAEDFDNAGVYPLITFGKLSGIDTTSATTVVNPFGETWGVNDVLYMAKTDGGLTKFRPTGTNTQIQRIAKVLNVGTTNGQIFIFNTARTAGLPNLTTGYLWVGNGDDLPQEVIRTDVGITTTGFTYNDNNTFTITDDNGGSLSATINQVSGLTINGDLDVTGDTTLNTLTATSITSNSAIDVFNGHINLRDNSYFLQGRTVADGNVSLIGVDNQDRVFVGNAGYDTYIDSDTIVDGSLTATTLNITTIGTGALVNNLGVDASGNVVSGNTNTGIYGGDGTIPLNTTASVNGDLTFQGLDEDTRIILKDGNNGGEVHLFSDGSAGQSALEFYNPGGVTLTSKIQNAGGDTRYISNNRDLLFTTNTGVTTEGFFIEAGTGNMGIGTTTPSEKLEVVQNTEKFRLNLDFADGPQAALSTTRTDIVSRFVASDGVVSTSMNTVGFDWTGSTVYGNPGDSSIYSNTSANGISIISAPGTGTEDYIRFYAGGNPQTSTASMHIQGDGSTIGNVGIGTETPLVELHVKGDSSILRLETTSANNSNYIEFYDPSERKGWIGYPSSTSSTDALFIRNEEHGSKIIISNTDSGGTSRTAIDIDANHNVALPFGDLDISGTLTIGALGTGTSVNNLGIDASGNVVSGSDIYVTGGTYSSGTLTLDRNDGNSVSVSGFTSGNATVENYYYQISNSVDTRPIFQDSFVTINWDETGNDLEFQMDVAPGGSGDMRSLAYLVGGATQNTFITTTATPYDVYAAGVAAGNRLECFITAENDDTHPAYHITVYNTGESFLNSVWIKKIIKN